MFIDYNSIRRLTAGEKNISFWKNDKYQKIQAQREARENKISSVRLVLMDIDDIKKYPNGITRRELLDLQAKNPGFNLKEQEDVHQRIKHIPTEDGMIYQLTEKGRSFYKEIWRKPQRY